MRIPGQIADFAHRNARRFQVDHELRQPLMPILGLARGPHQRDHVMRPGRVRRPDFLTVQFPAAIDLFGAAAHAGQIRPRIRLAHPDAKEALARANPRQIALFLLFRSEPLNQRAALPIRDPMRRYRRTGGQQFFDDHETAEKPGLLPAIFLADGQAQPAAFGHLAAEIGRKPHP